MSNYPALLERSRILVSPDNVMPGALSADQRSAMVYFGLTRVELLIICVRILNRFALRPRHYIALTPPVFAHFFKMNWVCHRYQDSFDDDTTDPVEYIVQIATLAYCGLRRLFERTRLTAFQISTLKATAHNNDLILLEFAYDDHEYPLGLIRRRTTDRYLPRRDTGDARDGVRSGRDRDDVCRVQGQWI